MSCSRRKLIKSALSATAAAALPISAFRFLSPAECEAATGKEGTRWGFLVDTN